MTTLVQIAPDGIRVQGGWYPLLRFSQRASDNRVIVRVNDWRGGEGVKPQTGWIKPDGTITQDMAEAQGLTVVAAAASSGLTADERAALEGSVDLSTITTRSDAIRFEANDDTAVEVPLDPIIRAYVNANVLGFARDNLVKIEYANLADEIRDDIDGAADASTLAIDGTTLKLSDNEGNESSVTLPATGDGGGEANPAAATQAEATAGMLAALRSWSPLRIVQAVQAAVRRLFRDDADFGAYTRIGAPFALTSGHQATVTHDAGNTLTGADKTITITATGLTGSASVSVAALLAKPDVAPGVNLTVTGRLNDAIPITLQGRQFHVAHNGTDLIIADGQVADQRTIMFSFGAFRLKAFADRAKSVQVGYDDINIDSASTGVSRSGNNQLRFTAGSGGGLSTSEVNALIHAGVTTLVDQEEWPAGANLPAASAQSVGDKYNLSGVEYRVEEAGARNQLHVVTIGTDGNYRGARKRAGVSDVGAFSDSALTGYQVYWYDSENVPQNTAHTIIALPKSVIGSSPPAKLYAILISADRAVAYIELDRASGSDTTDSYVWSKDSDVQLEPTAQAPVVASFYNSDFRTPYSVVASSKRWVLDDADDRLNRDAVDKRIDEKVESWARDDSTEIPAAKLGDAPVTAAKVLDAAQASRSASDRGKVLATGADDENSLALTDFPHPAHATLMQDDVGTGVTVTNSGQTFRSSPTAVAFDSPIDIDDNPHGHFVVVADIRLQGRGSNTIGFDEDTSEPQLTARINSVVSATELAATSAYDSSQQHGVEVGDQDIRNGSATLGRFSLLLVHDSTGQVRYDVIIHAGSGALSYTVAIDRIYAYFVPSDAPAATAPFSLTDDAVLDLAKTTRVTADRGRTLALSSTNENDLALSYRFQQVTQAAYDAIGTKDANTLYIIIG